MTRHMLLTLAIVFGVYASLLFIIGHPFAAWATDSDAAPVVLDQQSQPQASPQPSAKITRSAAQSSQPLFKGPVIVGISATVDLNNAEQEVNQVWRQLLSNQALINNVDWSKGNIVAYAYYSEFDTNMGKARLSLGFSKDDLKLNSNMPQVNLPTGQFEKFTIDPNTGVASIQAWAQAYVHKNLIERHILNRNGEQVSSDAIVLIQ